MDFFLVYARFVTKHPSYANVSGWAMRPGLLKFNQTADTPADAKMQALRLISRAGGLSAYADAVVFPAAEVADPLAPVLPDTYEWTL